MTVKFKTYITRYKSNSGTNDSVRGIRVCSEIHKLIHHKGNKKELP